MIGTDIGPIASSTSWAKAAWARCTKARDARLQRNVAIKILPAVFAADGDRLSRFQREAHVLASLNHPHIAQIYGVEERSGVLALVMELVDGRTLADMLADVRIVLPSSSSPLPRFPPPRSRVPVSPVLPSSTHYSDAARTRT